MRFIDEVEISVEAGSGGNGCVSFRREKYIPRGGPDGGNGGRGGSIYLLPTRDKLSLYDFKFQPKYQAKRGEHGKGSDMDGRGGEDLIISVPVGTLVYDSDQHYLLADLTQEGEPFLIAEGGKGGRGNLSFVSSTNRAPRQFTKGALGQVRNLKLELKLIADVGLVGLPNAGKSTFLAAITNAKPKIANYPFTTLEPYLGVLHHQGTSVVIADLPGLIEGASSGVGLGFKFLRHLFRTSIFLHLVELTEDMDILKQNVKTIRKEISAYDLRFTEKQEILVFTKADLFSEESQTVLIKKTQKLFPGSFVVSSHSHFGTETLLNYIVGCVQKLTSEPMIEIEENRSV